LKKREHFHANQNKGVGQKGNLQGILTSSKEIFEQAENFKE